MPKRGLIVLVLTWIVLLFLPAFRGQTRKLIDNLGGENQNFYSVRDEWDDMKKSHPNNAQLAFLDVRAQGDSTKPQYWRDLDALLARFPDDLNLRRARLIEATRQSGGLVRPIYAPIKANQKPTAADLQKSEQWQNAAQRAALVRAARLGEKQAPNDGFFPWMEAMALWNRNDEAALQALERAAKTSDFDDGTIGNQRALVALRETQTSLESDEKIAIMSGVLFPHFVPLREMARQMTASGIEHYKRGDKAGAYRRWRAVLEASGTFRRGENQGPQSTVIGVFVAEAMEKLVWENVAAELNPPARVKIVGSPAGNGDDAKAAARLRAFVELARRDGQSDLAAYAVRENASFEGRKLGRAIMDNLNRLGLDSPVAIGSIELPWIERVIFWLSIAGGLGLLICLVWRWRVGGARWFAASGAQIAFFGALWLGALALALWGRINFQMQQFGGLTDETTGVSAASLLYDFCGNPETIWLAITATLALSIAFVYWGDAREKSRLQQQILPRDNAATSPAWWPNITALAWFLVVVSTLVWFLVSSDGDYNVPARAVWIVLCLLALGLSFWRIERSESDGKLRSRWALLGAICGLIGLGFVAQFGQENNDIAFYVAAINLMLATAILIYLAANSRGWRTTLPRAIAVALQTLGGVAALCALALLLVSLAALPVRARQNRIVDDYIQRGEIDWMGAHASANR